MAHPVQYVSPYIFLRSAHSETPVDIIFMTFMESKVVIRIINQKPSTLQIVHRDCSLRSVTYSKGGGAHM